MADDPYARIAELEAEVRRLQEQQVASADGLRVIATGRSEIVAVLQEIFTAARRLIGGIGGHLMLWDGECLRIAVSSGPVRAQIGELHAISERCPPVRAFVERRTVTIADRSHPSVRAEYPDMRYASPQAMVTVPLVRDGVGLGVFEIGRERERPFTAKEIALLETFADQAVIAIENARLFEELERRNRDLTEALEQQAATADILRVVASAPTNLHQVLDAMVVAVKRLTEADGASAMRLDTEEVVFMASTSPGLVGTRRPAAGSVTLHVLDEGRTVHTYGSPEEQLAQFPANFGAALDRLGAQVITPLMRNGKPFGTLNVVRRDMRPFTDREIALLETFADQAVIAIENARLFRELQEANRQLGDANSRLADASEHKSQFLANMSHELRTPLNAIIGYSEMLQEEAEDLGDETYIPDLQRVNAAGKHLLGLINDILDLSKIEAGRMDLFLETFEVAAVIEEVQAVARPLIGKNGNTLVIECPADIGMMTADQTKVRQALFNLLSNAAKFTDRGTITLTVAREADD